VDTSIKQSQQRPTDRVAHSGKESNMEERTFRWRRTTGVLAAFALVAAACGGGGGDASPAATDGGGSSPAATDGAAPSDGGASPSDGGGGGQIGGTVSVIGTWGGGEQESFEAMIAPFEEQTGVDVQYTGTRDINTVLSTGVQSGILPDVAGLPGPGQMRDWAEQGALKPLGDVLDIAAYQEQTAPALVELGTVNDDVYGIFIKAAVKGLIWYNPTVYTAGEPASWDALTATDPAPAENLWCIALESQAASGWPGTDWIEDFVLRQSGPDIYDAWVAGTHPWTSPEIRQAFEAFGSAVENSYGGSDAVLTTAFQDGGNQLFTDPPGCLFHHQASFITEFFVNQGGAQEGQYDFFRMPDLNPQFAGATTGAGDLFGMFNDTEQARALMAYLVTPEAQAIWVERGGALSANTQVTTYPDEISQRSAEILANAGVFRFDGSDLMPVAMNDAFWKAILDYVNDPSQLDSILTSLDETQASAYGG
jgi:alpha-glucoside transport system substrate-binding protein